MVSRPLFLFDASEERDDASGEVESAMVVADHHFGRVRIGERFKGSVGGERHDECGDVRGSILFKRTSDGFELRCLNERFVALHVDDDICLTAAEFVGFPTAVRTASVGCGGHDGFSAELFNGTENAVIVSGDIDFLKLFRNTFINPLNDGLAI